MVRTNEERALDAFSIEHIDNVLPKDHPMSKEHDLRWIGNVRIDVRSVIECQSSGIRNSTRGDHATGLSFRGMRKSRSGQCNREESGRQHLDDMDLNVEGKVGYKTTDISPAFYIKSLVRTRH